jgi:hypothetical protein
LAHLSADATTLHLHLGPLEVLGALHGDIDIPLSEISDISLEERPWRSLRGIRAPGTGIPWVIAYGTRRRFGVAQRDFSLVRGGGPAVRIECVEPAPFARLVVTVRDAQATVTMLRRAAGLDANSA